MALKIIHQIVGPSPSDLIIKCLKSWERLEELHFKIMIWSDATITDFLTAKFPFALEAFTTARNYAEAADLARYLIVYEYGGYYVDWDIELINLVMFKQLHKHYDSGYLLFDPMNGSIASEHFSAQKNEPYLFLLSNDIVDTFNRGERELMNTPNYSGPYRMKVSLKKHNGSRQELLAIKEVFEYDYWEIRNPPQRTPTKAMIHYWMHSWMK